MKTNIYRFVMFAFVTMLCTNVLFAQNGATISFSNQDADNAYVCTTTEEGNTISFTNTSEDASYRYVLVANGLITTWTDGLIDLGAAAAGQYTVYGVAFTGEFTAQVDDNFETAVFSDGEWDLSSNVLTIGVGTPEGGAISTTQSTSADFIYICPGDGNADLVTLVNNSPSPFNYGYLFTDADNQVISIYDQVNTIDFEDTALSGEYKIYGVSYTGTLQTDIIGQSAFQSVLSDDCYAISDNGLNIFMGTPAGGEVAANGETSLEVCSSDGVDDVLNMTTTSSANLDYSYVITDTMNNIIFLAQSNLVDFSNASEGVFRIWGYSFAGQTVETSDVQGQTLTEATVLATSCHALSSNYVTVRSTVVSAGTPSANGQSQLFYCVGDNVDDLIFITSDGSFASTLVNIVTDENGVIESITDNDAPLNFEGTGEGVSRVWTMSYTGELSVTVGDNISDATSSECFDVSDNFITVTKIGETDGGMIDSDRGTEFTTCVNANTPNIVTFSNNSTSPANYFYVITDANDLILAAVGGHNEFDFNNVDETSLRVYGLAAGGQPSIIVGDNITEADFSSCFELSSNFITVTKDTPSASNINVNGVNELYICLEGEVQPFTVTTDATSDYAYVVTNEEGNITEVSMTNEFDFSDAAAGVFNIQGFTYIDGVNTELVGQSIEEAQLSNGCFELSSNAIRVETSNIEGGQVSTGEATEIEVCLNSTNTSFEFTSTATGGTTAYVVTDENNNILAFPASNMIDFAGAEAGICRVWSLTYTGTVTAEAGQNAGEVVLTDGCYKLSSNYVTINRISLDTATVSLEGGATEIEVCVGDEMANELTFTNSSSATNFAYVITGVENNILALSTSNTVDFNTSPAGVCRVWGLAYTGSVTAEAGQNAAEVALTDGCFQLSSNYVTVNRLDVDGGMVSTADNMNEVAVCVGTDNNAEVEFITTSTDENFAYVITDAENNIISVSESNTIDFSAAPAGECRVWGLAYSGTVTAEAGQNAAEVALTDACYELSSNYVTIVRTSLDAGTVALEGGAVEIDVCIGDEEADELVFTATSEDANLAYVITDENNRILGFPESNSFDFNGSPAGVCRVWVLSYTGSVTAVVGDNAAEVALTDGCYELSSNFVTVNRISTEGTTVSTINEEEAITVCVGTTASAMVEFTTALGTEGVQYIVTDAENNILAFPESNMIDFTTAEAGECRVFALTYAGELTAQVGDNVTTTTLADNCHALSTNYVTVTREGLDAATVSLEGGATEIDVCLGDANELTFAHTGTENNTAYVVTDAENNILAFPASDTIDFATAEAGVCRVWVLSYTGSVTAVVGDNAGEVALTDACYQLSTNYVTVNRLSLTGGTITSTDGFVEATICVGDEEADVFTFQTTSEAANIQYVVTDTNNVIVTLLEGDAVDFNGAEAGESRVFAIAYTGDLSVGLGDDVMDNELSNGCYALSQNYFMVTKDDSGDNCVTSNRDLELAQFNISPNPVNELVEVTIDMPVVTGQPTMAILNSLGQLVKIANVDYTAGVNTTVIDVNDLTVGVYFLRIESNGKSAVKRFVKL